MYLSCHSWFSLRYGVHPPERLVEQARLLGIEALALTDINNTSAAWTFCSACRAAGIEPVLGIDFRDEAGRCLYVGLARNGEGWRQLNELLTRCSLGRRPLPPNPQQLHPCPDVWFIYPRLSKPIAQFAENELLGVRPEHVHRLFDSDVRRHLHKLVAFAPATFISPDDYSLHRMLRAIDCNTVIGRLEGWQCAPRNELLHPPQAMARFYEAWPRLLQQARMVMDSCTAELDSGPAVNRRTFGGSRADDYALLEKLAIEGCRQRYGAGHREALARVRRELEVIRQQDFCACFLIAWDVVRYARSMGYHHVGRGSGANSIVAFCLHITDVDPLELDLYFERFLNPHRAAPPDFDIDFSWDERDDVLDYLFKRYGRDHTALLAACNTFKERSALRELGKVQGLPPAELDALSENPAAYVAAGGPYAELGGRIWRWARRMQGMPNYLSIHAGGVLIAQRPITYHTALQLMPKGFPVTHFDMHEAEAIGFHKFDVLSQRGLGHIRDAVALIRTNRGQQVDVHDVRTIMQDERVRQLLREGRCMGCFYIESPAMRGLLRKLRCETWRQLVAASSIIRPGVARSGMMHTCIERFHNPAGFRYPHPVFEELLGETFGIMVWQEDVLKVVHHFAGLSLEESDVLRRIMTGKKYKGDTLERLKAKFFDNCRRRGHSEALAQEVWRQIEHFSGYSFCKAHSASFAVESFQSLWLKAHYPLEFMVAVINNFGGFYRTEYYVHEARMWGARIHAPCVNHSEWLTSLSGRDIWLGFVHLKGMERQTATRIVVERARGGPFRSLADFVQRVPLSDEQLELLIRIGAFRFTGCSKYQLMWHKGALLRPAGPRAPLLFDDEPEAVEELLPPLEESPWDQAFDEMELLGFPLCSPFELLAQTPPPDTVPAVALDRCHGRMVRIAGYYVCRKPVRTVKGELMAFGTWLDAEGHFFDTVHFPDMLAQCPFRGKGVYLIEGKVVVEYGHPSIEVLHMERLPWRKDERFG